MMKLDHKFISYYSEESTNIEQELNIGLIK